MGELLPDPHIHNNTLGSLPLLQGYWKRRHRAVSESIIAGAGHESVSGYYDGKRLLS